MTVREPIQDQAAARTSLLCSEVAARLKAVASHEVARLRSHEAELAKASTEIERLEGRRSVHREAAERVFLSVRWRWLARRLCARDLRRVDEITAAMKDLAYRRGVLERRSAAKRARLAKAGRAFGVLQQCSSGLGPMSLEDELRSEALARRFDLLATRQTAITSLLPFAVDLADFAVRLARIPKGGAVRAPVRPLPRRPEAPTVPGSRVFLPIPLSKWPAARRLGAKEADDVPRGVSPFYIETGMDPRPFADMLPAMLDRNRTFSFPPVQFAAAGQNLWGLFDRDTWNHVRRTSYASHGHRCSVCGGRGGPVARQLFPDGRRNGVECHEVWEWSSVDRSSGVGVQKLSDLLVVCVSCHATFHEGYFASLARQAGVEDEVVADIARRRMLMNGLAAPELEAQIARERKEFSALDGIRDWIVDLNYLSRRQFMSDVTPVMKEGNAAGVSPSRVAGLRFETDRGFEFDNGTAARIAEGIVRDRRRPARSDEGEFEINLGGAGW